MFKLVDIFKQCGWKEIPTRKMENWKYTPINKLLAAEFNNFSKKNELIEIKLSKKEPLYLNQKYNKNTAQSIHQKIVVGENIHAEILFNHASEDETACFTNIFTEIVLEKNAKLCIYKKQRLNKNSFLIDFIQVNQAEESVFNSFTLDNGATLSRTDFIVNLNAPHAEANLQGVYLTKDEQIADHHSVIHHHAPHCQSKQHYRGILQDKSKAIFNGKVIFEKDAQKSVTQQLNKNLLLSNQAEIDTKPELEIYADDVKASHGATVGQLDQQALFYLQARGIHLQEAKGLLMEGFLKEVFLTIENKELQNSFVGATGGRPLQI